MKPTRTRRKRRQDRARLHHGAAAAPAHTGKSGRTGAMHRKKLLSRDQAPWKPAPESSGGGAAPKEPQA